MAGGSEVCHQLSPDESKDRSKHMTMMSMSANVNGVGVGMDVDSNRGESDGGVPRHSLRFAAVPRSLSRSASMWEVADDNLTVARLRRRENGRMTVCVHA